MIITHSLLIWIVKRTRVYLDFQKIRFDADKLSFHEKFHFKMHMWEKRFFKDPRFQNTKSWETVLEWLSEWKCTHIRSLFLRSFPYHHHCCMVQMRSDGRWLCTSVTPYKKSKKNVCLNALLLCDLETGYAKRNGERVKCLG